MSISFSGGGRVQRVLAIPSLASAFSAGGWVKLTGDPSGYGAFFELFKGSAPEQQLTVGHAGGSTKRLAAYVNGTGSNNVIDLGSLWVWLALRSTGGTVTVAVSKLATSGWDVTTDFTLSTDFTPTHLTIGGNIYEENAYNFITAGWKVWNEARTLADLLTQKDSLTPVSSSLLLSRHDMDGNDLDDDSTADAGGADAYLYTEGTGVAYSSDFPVIGGVSPVGITGGGTLPLSAAGSSTIPPWPVRAGRRQRR